MSTPWPPIIGNARVPWWVRLRDLVLTLLAWIVLLYAVSPIWIALWLDIQLLLGFRMAHVASIPPSPWHVLRPFLGVAALFALWLVSFAIVRRHLYLTKWHVSNQPPALPRKEQTERSGVSAELTEQLLGQRNSIVRFDAHGRLKDVDAR